MYNFVSYFVPWSGILKKQKQNKTKQKPSITYMQFLRLPNITKILPNQYVTIENYSNNRKLDQPRPFHLAMKSFKSLLHSLILISLPPIHS